MTNWATGATVAISPHGGGMDTFNRMKAIPPFWKAVSMDTAMICFLFNLSGGGVENEEENNHLLS